MSQLTFEEFRKLPRAQQNARCEELSEHDRLLARMSDWQPSDFGMSNEPHAMTKEEISRLPIEYQEWLERLKNP